jgi:hypothetical protein
MGEGMKQTQDTIDHLASRLRKDYEHHDIFSESIVYLASIGSLLRRLFPSSMTATRYHVNSTAA